jgi:hypothetical protein
MHNVRVLKGMHKSDHKPPKLGQSDEGLFSSGGILLVCGCDLAA